MAITLGGTNPAVTFPDATVQNTSAIVSGYVPYANLPAGSVLQVVNATYGSTVSTSSGTLADTGLTATITPKYATSKIFVMVQQNGCAKANNTYMQLVLLRGSTQLATFGNAIGFTNNSEQLRWGGIGMGYFDSPATTSATTYKTQYCSVTNAASVTLQDNNGLSTITLMEIAQ